MNLDIKYWDPSTMRDGAVVLIVGRRGSGKSTVAEDLMSYKRGVKRGICISATEKANAFWTNHIPSCFIHYAYDDKITRDLFAMQKKVKKKTGVVEPAFAIYDDLMFDKSFVKSKMTRRVFMNGRHDGIFTIVTAQWIMDVPPDLRANIDYVVVLRDNIRVNRERVYTYFAGVFPNFSSFDEVMQSCTNNHECLILDQTSLSYNISDCVYFYKATPDLKYRLGASDYWRYSNRRKSKELEEEEDSDISDEDFNTNKKKQVRLRKRYPKTE